MNSHAGSINLTVTDVETLRSVLKQLGKVDIKVLAADLGILETAATKRWSRLRVKVSAGMDATSTDNMGEMSSNKSKVSSFGDAVKKGKRAADDQEGREADKANKNAKRRVVKKEKVKKEKVKKDPFEDDEALDPALKEEFEDADQA